jgi:hypothetical protein
MFSLEFDYSENIIINWFPIAQKSRRPSGSIYDFPDRDEDLGVKTEFRRPKTPPARPSTSKGKGEAGSTEPKSKKVRREFDGIDESPKLTKVRREIDESPKLTKVRREINESPKSTKVRREIDETPKSTKVRRESEIDSSSIFDRFTFKKIILSHCHLQGVILIFFSCYILV